MPTLIQVCNVAEVMGGTGACAWTITRSLPEWRHVVAFPKTARPEVVREFAPAEVRTWPIITPTQIREAAKQAGRDREGAVVLLHNTAASRVKGELPAVVLQYVHSAIRPAPADSVRYCSRSLAERCGAGPEAVLYQAVPEPPRGESSDSRSLRRKLVVGRLCTPTPRKWPDEIVDWTQTLAARVPGIQWEFVGCPEGMQSRLREACSGEAVFYPASWEARRFLWQWDALVYHHPTITETFGRVVAEALRAGCVPVVDARGGFLEQVTPETGFVCATPEEFAAALKKLRDDHALRWRMSHAGRHRGRDLFSEEALADRLKSWIRQTAATLSERIVRR